VKKGLLVALAMLALASIASADMTRVATMGGRDVFLWDVENVRWCPALAAGYANQFVGELGYFPTYEGNQSLAAYLTNDEAASMGVFGLVANRRTAAVPNDLFLDPTPNFDLIYAKKMGTFGFGLMLSLARNSTSITQADSFFSDTSASNMVIGFTPGLTFVLGQKGSLDIGFGVQMNSFSNKETQNMGAKDVFEYASDGAMALDGQLRAMLPMGQYLFLVPFVGINMSNLNWKWTSPDTSVSITDDKRMDINAGIGVNIMPFEETTIIGGLTFGMSSEENSDAMFPDSINKSSSTAPAFVFGVESRFNSWMTGRVGASKYFFDSQSSEAYTGRKQSWASGNYNFDMGLGMNFGDFTIDAMLNDDFLFEGPEFIGGQGEVPNVMVSAVYNFSGM
jgi:hypothetical protein